MSLCLRPLIYKEHTKTEDVTQLIERFPGVNAALVLILHTKSVISSLRRGDRRTRSSWQKPGLHWTDSKKSQQVSKGSGRSGGGMSLGGGREEGEERRQSHTNIK